MTIFVNNNINLNQYGNIDVDSLDVGFFASATYDDGTSVASVAATHEFGDPENNIPERPFFRQTMAQLERDLLPFLSTFVVSLGNFNVSRAVGERVGSFAEGKVKRRIVDLRDPPNSPATIAAKGSSNPLIDTGHMRQSVTYKVNE